MAYMLVCEAFYPAFFCAGALPNKDLPCFDLAGMLRWPCQSQFTCLLAKPFMLLSSMPVPPHLDKDASHFVLAGML